MYNCVMNPLVLICCLLQQYFLDPFFIVTISPEYRMCCVKVLQQPVYVCDFWPNTSDFIMPALSYTLLNGWGIQRVAYPLDLSSLEIDTKTVLVSWGL